MGKIVSGIFGSLMKSEWCQFRMINGAENTTKLNPQAQSRKSTTHCIQLALCPSGPITRHLWPSLWRGGHNLALRQILYVPLVLRCVSFGINYDAIKRPYSQTRMLLSHNNAYHHHAESVAAAAAATVTSRQFNRFTDLLIWLSGKGIFARMRVQAGNRCHTCRSHGVWYDFFWLARLVASLAILQYSHNKVAPQLIQHNFNHQNCLSLCSN